MISVADVEGAVVVSGVVDRGFVWGGTGGRLLRKDGGIYDVTTVSC